MSFEGKTIARIEERPTDPEYRYARDDTLLIHFTDGTALKVSGSSYEEVSLGYAPMSSEDVLAWVRAGQGAREQARLERLKREAYEALPQEEKDRRERERWERMTPFERASEEAMRNIARSAVLDMNRSAFVGATISIPVQKRGRARRS